jgi:hypothetical protein
MAVHLTVLVDHAVSAVDTHRDAAEVVHRDGPTQQAPIEGAWRHGESCPDWGRRLERVTRIELA